MLSYNIRVVADEDQDQDQAALQTTHAEELLVVIGQGRVASYAAGQDPQRP